MKMTPEDYKILPFDYNSYYQDTSIRLTKNQIMVGSSFLSYGKECPEKIVEDGITYYFNGIDVMPSCLVGHYFSVAIYDSSIESKCEWS